MLIRIKTELSSFKTLGRDRFEGFLTISKNFIFFQCKCIKNEKNSEEERSCRIPF